MELEQAIVEQLGKVIDPETGVDVMRMRLVEDLEVDGDGVVRYTFRPSSPLCPMAMSLVLSIRAAVAEVEGVTGQEIEVAGYVRATELNRMLQDVAETESE